MNAMVYACGWYTMTLAEVVARLGQYSVFAVGRYRCVWDAMENRYVVRTDLRFQCW